MIKRPTTFAGTAVFTTAVVGAIALGVWFLHALFERILSTEHTIAGVTISPYGHSMESLLTHHFDSIRVSVEGTNIKIANPNLDVTLLGFTKGVTLEMDSLIAVIDPPKTDDKKQKKKSDGPLEFPEKLQFPIPVQVDVKNAQVLLSDGKGWQAKNISIQSEGKKAISLKAKQASGDFISSPANIDIKADFESDNLKLKGSIKTAKDSVALNVDAPKENLGKIKANTNLVINNPKEWIPADIPKAVPHLGAIKISANGSYDLQKNKTTYDAKIQTRIGEFWPLLAETVSIDVSGDQNNIEFDCLLKNDEGGTIQLSGTTNKDMEAFFTGRVSHMSAMFGPQMMPLDMEIKSGELYDKDRFCRNTARKSRRCHHQFQGFALAHLYRRHFALRTMGSRLDSRKPHSWCKV